MKDSTHNRHRNNDFDSSRDELQSPEGKKQLSSRILIFMTEIVFYQRTKFCGTFQYQ